MHPELCKNCEHTFQGNFCSNCGQKTNTKRLDWHFVKDELQYTFLHINKGLLYTAKQLITRPGKTVREFIDGKRVRHYKPILLVFVLAGLNGLATHYLHAEKIFETIGKSNQKSGFNPKELFEWIISHYAIVELLTIPIISVCSWLAFKKWGYNYIENIVINCFASGQRMLYGILTFPILFLLTNTKNFITYNLILSLPVYFVTFWLYFDLYNFNKRPEGNIILRILLFVVNILIAYILSIILGIIIGALLVHFEVIDKKMFIS